MTVTHRHFKTRQWDSKTTGTGRIVEVLICIEVANSKMVGFQVKNAVHVWTKKRTLYNSE